MDLLALDGTLMKHAAHAPINWFFKMKRFMVFDLMKIVVPRNEPLKKFSIKGEETKWINHYLSCLFRSV